jgi:putative transposon-encoded protein
MAKIIISQKEKKIEGKIIKGVVKPFGNSAHIPFIKKHIGKHINVIIPDDTFYCWVFSDAELKTFVNESKKAIEKHEGKMKPYYLHGVERIKNNCFTWSDISVACGKLQEAKKCFELVKKIERAYEV